MLLALAWATLLEQAQATQCCTLMDQLSSVSAVADSLVQTNAEPESSSSGLYGSVLVGLFKPTGTSEKLEAVGIGYGWGLSLGYQLIQWLGLEGEFLYFQGDYERLFGTLPPGTAGNQINMASVDISIRIRASYPIKEFRPFVGGGVGFFDSDLYTKGASSELFENAAGNQAAGWQALAGVTIPAMKQWRAELGWRWIHLRQDFGIYTDGEVELGGSMLYLAIVGGY